MLPTVVRLMLMRANSAEFNSCLFAAVANHHHHRSLSPSKDHSYRKRNMHVGADEQAMHFHTSSSLAGDDITVTSCLCGN
jgi:hypothetical protein